MTLFTKFAVIFMMIFTVLCFHQFQNSVVTQIIVIVSLVAYAVCSRLADREEQKLKDRIKALEDKLNDKE